MTTTEGYPGVYIEEVPSGVPTITAVATSIAAFLGRASKGPINEAVEILSPADYQGRFGDPHPKSDLAYAVRQFFQNGGEKCYVVRLAECSALTESTYQGNEADQTGFHALDAVDIFNLMILPGDEEVDLTNIWGLANTYCHQCRAFLLIDPPSNWTDNSGRCAVVEDTSMINELRSTLAEQDHAAVYYPRLKFSEGGVTRTIGSAGAIAGLMARTDGTRGVWKAPAGVEARIRNIAGLTVDLTDAENGVLNKRGINCIRAFPDGIVSWGARTLDGDDDFGSEWKYVPVRRTALMIAESLYRGTLWVVFEPNDEPLWANIRLVVGAFMFSLFRQGAFQGTSPKEAFYVRCDKETTTQDDRNNGVANIEVGFAPLKPAEFVVIKIQQKMADEL